MSDTKHSDTDLKNEDTVRRRAWIDRAVNSAKEHVSAGEEYARAVEERSRPRLYIIGSNNKK